MARNVKYKIGQEVLTQVTKWTLGKSAVKQTRFIRVSFKGGIAKTLYLTPGTQENVMKDLATMGFKGSNIQMLKEENALDMDKDLRVTIDDTREYEGNTYYDASWINPVGGSGFDESCMDMIDDFDIDTRAFIDDAKDISSPAPQLWLSLSLKNPN